MHDIVHYMTLDLQQSPGQYFSGTQPQNIVVVAQQPTAVPTTVQVTKPNAGQGPYIAALTVTMLAVFFGCWWSLVCSISAIYLANNVGYDVPYIQ